MRPIAYVTAPLGGPKAVLFGAAILALVLGTDALLRTHVPSTSAQTPQERVYWRVEEHVPWDANCAWESNAPGAAQVYSCTWQGHEQIGGVRVVFSRDQQPVIDRTDFERPLPPTPTAYPRVTVVAGRP